MAWAPRALLSERRGSVRQRTGEPTAQGWLGRGQAPVKEPSGHDDQDGNLPARTPRKQPRAARLPAAIQRLPQDPGPELQ
jgi:hypothetical protein